jgi:cell division protein FtsW
MALLVLQIPLAWWEKYAGYLFILALVLLVLVLIPGIGKVVNFSRRWIPLGVMNFQPSEYAKLAMAIYAAGYMVRKMDARENFIRAVWPMAMAVLVVGLLLLRQPDMGAFIVIATISMGVLFLGGVNARMFFLIAAMAIAALAMIIAFDELRRGRILAYLDPWDPANAQGKAYQLTHSLIAFGRGGLFGQGLGSSVEKLHYLPEAHTDFLLAVIGEELGLVGVLAVIVGFFWLIRRIVNIGRQAIALDRVFAGLMGQGIGIGFLHLGEAGFAGSPLAAKGTIEQAFGQQRFRRHHRVPEIRVCTPGRPGLLATLAHPLKGGRLSLDAEIPHRFQSEEVQHRIRLRSGLGVPVDGPIKGK